MQPIVACDDPKGRGEHSYKPPCFSWRYMTRAWLIGAIQDAVLAEYGAKEGSERRSRGQYLCPCGETFDRIVWHCEGCATHWPLEREVCGNCQAARPERTPLHDLEGIDPSLFKLATRALAF